MHVFKNCGHTFNCWCMSWWDSLNNSDTTQSLGTLWDEKYKQNLSTMLIYRDSAICLEGYFRFIQYFHGTLRHFTRNPSFLCNYPKFSPITSISWYNEKLSLKCQNCSLSNEIFQIVSNKIMRNSNILMRISHLVMISWECESN